MVEAKPRITGSLTAGMSKWQLEKPWGMEGSTQQINKPLIVMGLDVTLHLL